MLEVIICFPSGDLVLNKAANLAQVDPCLYSPCLEPLKCCMVLPDFTAKELLIACVFEEN